MAYTFNQSDIDNLNNNHVTMTLNGVPVAVNDVVNSGDVLEATTGAGYVFTSGEVYFRGQNPHTGMPNYLHFNLSSGNTVANVTFDSGSYFSLTVNTEVLGPDYVVKQSDIDALTLANATLKINGNLAVVGSEIYNGDELLAEALDGYSFYPETGSTTSSVYFSGQTMPHGISFYLSFNLSEDNKTATVVFDNGDNEFENFRLYVYTVQSTEVTGTNNVYLINTNQLTELNEQRFDGTPPDVYDYGQFILNVLELPFSIDESIILEPENIMLSTYETTVEAPKVATDKIVVDLGSITVPANSGNLLDFKNVTTVLHLPRIDSVVIDVDYVVGQTVSVEYIIDCYTGVATVNISSTKIDGVVLTRQVDIGINIPFAVERGSASPYNTNINVGGDNGIAVPFIEVITNDAILPYGFFTIPIIDEGQLSGEAGYIQVENIDLETTATLGEQNQIKSILTNGVIIK